MAINLIRNTSLILGLGFTSLAFAVTNVNCPTTSGTTIDSAALLNGYASDNKADCLLSPIALKVTFYSISFCPEEPTPSNYQTMCNRIFHFPAGKEVTIEPGKSSTLFDGDISIPEGNYPFAAMLIGNTPKLKMSATFDQPFTGANGSSGTTCWTNGNDAKDKQFKYGTYNLPYSTTCGTAAQASPTWTTKAYKAIKSPDPADNWKWKNEGLYLTHGYANKNSYFMSDENTQATVTLDSNSPWDEQLVQSNAQQILSVQKFDTPAVVSPDKENIDLGFDLTNFFYVEVTKDSSANNDPNPGMGCTPIAGTTGCAVTFHPKKLEFYAKTE